MKITFRSLHRDLGYFFLGLTITFSISGLFLNHRQIWHPMRYAYEARDIQVSKALLSQPLTKEIANKISIEQQVKDKIRRFATRQNKLWITYENSSLEISKLTGKGTIKKMMITPLLGQMTQLHTSASNFWIYYSDIFAISMLIIAISAMVFPKGKKGFKKYGWKLGLAGLVFPLVFLVFLNW